MTPISGSNESVIPYIQGISVNTMDKLMTGMVPKFSAGSNFKRVMKGSHCVEEVCFDDSLVTPTLKMINPLSNDKGFVDVDGTWVSGSTTSPLTDAGQQIVLVPNHEVERRDFGQPKFFKDDEPYEDMKKFHPVHFLLDDNNTLMYPLILWNASMTDPDQFDGVIEPLTVRSRASRQNPENPFFGHDIRGLLVSDAGECSRLRANRIVQMIDMKDTSFDWYEDGIENFGAKLLYQNGEEKTGPVHPGYLTLNDASISPFIESTDWEEIHEKIQVSDSVAHDPGGMQQALLDMAQSEFTRVSGATASTHPSSVDSLLARDHKSSGAGFTYNNNELGTDSLAFGGLLK